MAIVVAVTAFSVVLTVDAAAAATVAVVNDVAAVVVVVATWVYRLRWTFSAVSPA